MARSASLTSLAVVADTGALYALLDRDDAWYLRVTEWWMQNRLRVVLPVTIVPELAYLLGARLGARAEEAFARALADREFVLEPLDEADLPRVADLVASYADVALGVTDASVVAIAERLGAAAILTTDRRHFGAVRPRHVPAFRLLP
ncbi:MAG: PIN domain-containing protein [Gemmatimonadales bacterium]|nr:PIN domain-containing protein [Gemmatimonadales bacterium]